MHHGPTRDDRLAGRARASLPRPAVAAMRSWLSAIDELATAVNSAQPLDVLLDMVAMTACRLLTYESCAVLLADDDRAALHIRGYHRLQAEYVRHVNDNAPLLLSGDTDLGDGPSRRPSPPTPRWSCPTWRRTRPSAHGTAPPLEQGYRAMAALPLRSQGQVIGTVNVYSPTPRQPDPAGLELLQVLTNHAGIALETTALLDRDRARMEELTGLNESLRRQTVAAARGGRLTDAPPRRRATTAAPWRARSGEDATSWAPTIGRSASGVRATGGHIRLIEAHPWVLNGWGCGLS